MQVNDTNTTYLCQELRSIGCEVVRVTIVQVSSLPQCRCVTIVCVTIVCVTIVCVPCITIVQVSSLPQCRCVIVACVTIVCVPCVTIVCVTIACVTIARVTIACVTIVRVTIVCVTIACVTIVRSLPSHATLVLGGLPLKAYLGWPELCVYIHVCKMYVFFILSEEKCYCGSELAFSA
jgi:hypothetical protein